MLRWIRGAISERPSFSNMYANINGMADAYAAREAESYPTEVSIMEKVSHEVGPLDADGRADRRHLNATII